MKHFVLTFFVKERLRNSLKFCTHEIKKPSKPPLYQDLKTYTRINPLKKVYNLSFLHHTQFYTYILSHILYNLYHNLCVKNWNVVSLHKYCFTNDKVDLYRILANYICNSSKVGHFCFKKVHFKS